MILTASALRRRYGGISAVDGVSLTVSEGEIVGICGPNGAGKTTLFDLLTGFSVPDEGKIRLQMSDRIYDLTGKPPHRFARAGILRTFQQIRLYEDRTVEENIALARLGCKRRCLAEEAEALLYELGLASVAEQRAGALSYGERRLVEIARAIAGGALLLFLDEPAAGMSEWETGRLGERLAAFRETRGIGIVVIEHDLAFLKFLSDRVICMAEGKILSEGKPEEVFGDRAVIHALLGE